MAPTPAALRSPVRIRSSEPVGFSDALTAARLNVALMSDALAAAQAEERARVRAVRHRSFRPTSEAARSAYRSSFSAFLDARAGGGRAQGDEPVAVGAGDA
jgi:hypothetical protein